MTMLFAVIVLAFVLAALLGDPHGRFHPVALFGSAAAEVERFCRASAGAFLAEASEDFLGGCLR